MEIYCMLGCGYMVVEAGAGCGLRMDSLAQLFLGVCVGVSRFFASYIKN